MFRTFVHVQLMVVGAMLFAGCTGTSDGLRILDELRRDGLIVDDGGEVAPAVAAMAGNDESWSGLESALAGAASAAEGVISLAILLSAADHLNPRIAAARAQIGEVGGRAWQASFYPNPTLGVESENVEFSGGFGVSETTVSVSQPIVVGGRRDAAVAAGDAKLGAARWELQRVRREIHGRICKEVTEIVYAQRAIALHENLRELAQRTADVAKTRFNARAAPESEAIRAQVEVNNLELSIERLRGEMAASAARLGALLGGHQIDAARIDDHGFDDGVREAMPALEVLDELVRSSHPAVLAAEADIEVANRQVDFERSLRWADIAARVGVGVNHADDEGFVEAGVGIPLAVFDRNDGAVLAARFGVIRAQKQAQAVQAELVGTLGEAYRRWESAVARLAVYEEQILDGAQRSLTQASAGYEAGRLAFLDVLDAQRTLIEARLGLIELRRAVSISRAEMYEILGDQINTQDQQGDSL